MTNSTPADQPVLANQTLTQQAYASADKLQVRHQTHEKYTVPRFDFSTWVVDSIEWAGTERVLDLGAGPGNYFSVVKSRIPWGEHYAGDLSFGMMRRQRENEAASGSNLTNFDAQCLPFASNSFDVVLANHMLYHIPDIDLALTEIKRVLKPTGLLLATTNSTNNMPELKTLYRRALLLLTNFQQQPTATDNDSSFTLENASQIMSRHFYAVARHDLPSALIFPEAQPVLAYLESKRDLHEATLPANITWEDYINVMSQQVMRLIEHSGKMVVKKLSGVIIATDSGGFVTDFVKGLSKDE